jgi:hypothetical protein
MKSPLEVIQDFGAPTHSYVEAVQYFNDRDFTKEEYEKGYNDILGTVERVAFSNFILARYHFLYSVQETIRASLGGVPDMVEIMDTIENRIAKLKDSYPFLFEESLSPTGEIEHKNMDAAGLPKRKKGTKKALTKEVYVKFIEGKDLSRSEGISILVEKVGLKNTVASTYLSHCKSGKF